MTNPWPRRLSFISVLVFLTFAVALLLRAPRTAGDLGDLRDAVSDHDAMLSAGHASLGQGASSCVYCHLAHVAKAQRPLWQTHGSIDAAAFTRESERAGGVKTGLCMSCHDGTIAGTIKAHALPSGSARHAAQGDLGANHPVGVDYMAAVRRDPGSYNDPAMNVRIVLEEGKVGCVSCHSTHDSGAVSAGNVRQDICTACHSR